MGQITVSAELLLGTSGTLLGLASLITTIVLWRRSGPRVVVEAAVIQLIPGEGQAVTDVVQVTARNTGRAATTIDNWWLQGPSGGGFVIPNPEVKTHVLPHRLEAEGSASWYVALSKLEQACSAAGVQVTELKPGVALGSGRRIVSSRTIRTVGTT